jgi:VanZ family protein
MTPSVAWVFFAIYLLVMRVPNDVPIPRLPGLDKIAHVAIFAIYVLLTAWGFFRQKTFYRMQQYALPLAIAMGLFLGMATEWIQHAFVPHRSGDVYDVIADALGCLLASLLFLVYRNSFFSRFI